MSLLVGCESWVDNKWEKDEKFNDFLYDTKGLWLLFILHEMAVAAAHGGMQDDREYVFYGRDFHGAYMIPVFFSKQTTHGTLSNLIFMFLSLSYFDACL